MSELAAPKSLQVVPPGVVGAGVLGIVGSGLARWAALVAHWPNHGLAVLDQQHRSPPPRKNPGIGLPSPAALQPRQAGQRLVNLRRGDALVLLGLLRRLGLQAADGVGLALALPE